MNKDLAVDSADWRALFGARWRRFHCFICPLVATFQRAAGDGFAADDASVSGDGHSSRCCTLEGFSQDCDCVSVIALQEKCDEKGLGAGSGHRSVRCRQFGRKGRTPSCFAQCKETTESGGVVGAMGMFRQLQYASLVS